MKKKLRMVIIADISLYIIQYIIIPVIYKKVNGYNNEGWATLIISTAIAMIIEVILLSDKLTHLLLSFFIYVILMFIYTFPMAYGIGGSISFYSSYNSMMRWFGIVTCVILVFLIKLAVWVPIKLFRLIKAKIANVKEDRQLNQLNQPQSSENDM